MAHFGDKPGLEKIGGRRAWTHLYAPLFLWIGVIFLLSSGSGSMAATSRIIRPLLEFLFPTASEESLQLMHFYIRKCAHFTEYAVLAWLALRAFTRGAIGFLKSRFYLSAFGVVLTIAALDEFNQRFISSRTGSIWDVVLDVTGGVFAIGVWHLLLRRKER